MEQCLTSDRMVETAELESIADKISDDTDILRNICRKLDLAESKLKDFQTMQQQDNSTYTPAYRLLYTWAQINDQVSQP